MNTQILVCDDDGAVREVVSVVLELAGYSIETAEDGAAALKAIRDRPDYYSLLLTDHKMPRLDGLELVRELRAFGFPGKIIVLSGRLDHADVVAYNDLGVDGIMLKPFDFKELRKAVSGVLSPEARQEILHYGPAWNGYV